MLELEEQGVLDVDWSVPLGVLLDKYMSDRDLWDKAGRTKLYVIRMQRPLMGESFDIAMRQPKNSEFIFPYNSRSVTAGFQRVRNRLGIEDLRYHDLRREGASRLFEKGYSIEEVAQVTGHRNLNILWQVYTQLFPHELHKKAN